MELNPTHDLCHGLIALIQIELGHLRQYRFDFLNLDFD
jgi:hypothetical protein